MGKSIFDGSPVAGFALFYRVPLAWRSDEDGVHSMVALGHHEPRRMVAAVNGMARYAGLLGLGDGVPGVTYMQALATLRRTWAIWLADRCLAAIDGPSDELGECGGPTGCEGCEDVRQWRGGGGHVLAWPRPAGQPGGFPVTIWRWGYMCRLGNTLVDDPDYGHVDFIPPKMYDVELCLNDEDWAVVRRAAKLAGETPAAYAARVSLEHARGHH